MAKIASVYLVLISSNLGATTLHGEPALEALMAATSGGGSGGGGVKPDAVRTALSKPTSTALSSALSMPLIGRLVTISGLEGRADLNGKGGVAFSYHDGGRYGVCVHETSECVRLKPTNLTENKAQTGRPPSSPLGSSGGGSTPARDVATGVAADEHHDLMPTMEVEIE